MSEPAWVPGSQGREGSPLDLGPPERDFCHHHNPPPRSKIIIIILNTQKGQTP